MAPPVWAAARQQIQAPRAQKGQAAGTIAELATPLWQTVRVFTSNRVWTKCAVDRRPSADIRIVQAPIIGKIAGE